MRPPFDVLVMFVALAFGFGAMAYNCGHDVAPTTADGRCPKGTAVASTTHCLACCPVVNGRIDDREPCAVAVCLGDPR